MPANHLIKIQLGPVQEFIAQARTTRDLWSGSYLLSWLMASALVAAERAGGEVVFPYLAEQPLVHFFQNGTVSNGTLVPNLPNVAMFRISADNASNIGQIVEKAVLDEWRNIAAKCWVALLAEKLVTLDHKERFDRQVSGHFSLAWHTVEESADYTVSLSRIGRELDAVRATRAFEAWRGGGWNSGSDENKDSLNGRDERVAGGREWLQKIDTIRAPRGRENVWPMLFRDRHAGDVFGAITLIKRIWPWAYLNREKRLPTLPWRSDDGLKFPSTRHIALHDNANNEDDDFDQATDDKNRLDGYFAVLAFDGDHVGVFASGTIVRGGGVFSPAEHARFSADLSRFALRCTRPIVEACDGCLIYAGGDDVLALLPADTAAECARRLRQAYQADGGAESFALPDGLPGTEMDASVGIAIAHFKAPLQDAVSAAHEALNRAKTRHGRSALAVTLLKRSGESVEWGCQWDSGGPELLASLHTAMANGTASHRFPHRLAESLRPYAVKDSAFAAVPEFDADAVIAHEIAHIVRQQTTSSEAAAQLRKEWTEERIQRLLARETTDAGKFQSMIGLCATAAFTTKKNPQP